jgi:hypothetical protein
VGGYVAELRYSKAGADEGMAFFKVRAEEDWETLIKELQQSGKVDLDR